MPPSEAVDGPLRSRPATLSATQRPSVAHPFRPRSTAASVGPAAGVGGKLEPEPVVGATPVVKRTRA